MVARWGKQDSSGPADRLRSGPRYAAEHQLEVAVAPAVVAASMAAVELVVAAAPPVAAASVVVAELVVAAASMVVE